MRSVTYSMSVSLDGYIVGPDGGFDWGMPDEVFRFWIDEIRGVGVHLLGRRLYETMLYWETADQDPSLDASRLEFAALWKSLPKVVFSTTLPAVQGNARLASGDLAEEGQGLPGAGRRWHPVLPQHECRVDLELVETRTFHSKVVYLRYRVARQPACPPSPQNRPASHPGQTRGQFLCASCACPRTGSSRMHRGSERVREPCRDLHRCAEVRRLGGVTSGA